MARKKRLCVIITSALSLKLFRNQWTYWQNSGWDVTAICGPGENEHSLVRELGIKTYVVPFVRNPSPIKDIVALVTLWWFLLWHRFDVLHVSTPKASLQGVIAGRLSFHNKIYYLLRGRAYENMAGIKRWIMSRLEWISCHLSTIVVPICRELGQLIVSEGLCPVDRVKYVGSGSSAGIDLSKFTRTEDVSETASQLRKDFLIKDTDVVLIFVGWFRRDKGINELICAFKKLSAEFSDLKLILVGEFEESDPLESDTVFEIKNNSAIIHVHWQNDPAVYYAMADILVFPSYREGFGNVAIEASSMGVPVVASDIMGCREAVVHGQTGLLVTKGDSLKLADSLKLLIFDSNLRKKMSEQGRKRVELEFSQEIIFKQTQELLDGLCV